MNIENDTKLAIMQCVYQMIVSSDGGIVAWRDNNAIDYVLSELGLSTKESWYTAIHLEPYECIDKVSKLDTFTQYQFKELIYKIAEMGGNTIFRKSCAQQLLLLIGWR